MEALLTPPAGRHRPCSPLPFCTTSPVITHLPSMHQPTIGWVSGGGAQSGAHPGTSSSSPLLQAAQRLGTLVSPRPLFRAVLLQAVLQSLKHTSEGGGQTYTSTLPEYVSTGCPAASSGLNLVSVAGWGASLCACRTRRSYAQGHMRPRAPSFRAASFPTLPHMQPPCKSHPGARRTTLPSRQFHL